MKMKEALKGGDVSVVTAAPWSPPGGPSEPGGGAHGGSRGASEEAEP